MSTSPQPRVNGAVKQSEQPKVPANILDMSPGELMKAMGGNGWWNPQSNDQITWRIADSDEETVPRALYRMDAWMTWYTTSEGNRQPYANKNGIELHLAHMAKDLGIEIHNLRTYWRLGARMGLWRSGTKDEGTKRLYRCAKIAPVAESEPQDDEKGVCTNPLPEYLQEQPPYMQEQLKRLPPERWAEIERWHKRHTEVARQAEAEFAAVRRMVFVEIEYSGWQAFGIQQNRLGPRQAKSPAEEAEIAERRRRIETLLKPVEGYVHTLFDSVQTEERGMDTSQEGSVQLVSGAPSLLGSETSEIPDLRAGGDLNRQTVKNGHSKLNEGERAVQVHAGEEADAKQEETVEREKAVGLLNLLRKLFESQPRRFSGERPNPKNKGDVATAVKIVRALGSEPVEAFARYVEQKAGSRALGYRLTLALISELPEDYHDALAEERELVARRQEQEEKARVLAEAAAKRMEEAEAEDARYEAMFRELPDEERSRRLAIAEQELKATPRWKNVLRYRDDLRQIEIENRALQVFRSEKQAEVIRQENEEVLRQMKQGKGAAS